MDKKNAVERLKKTVTLFLSIRRGFKIYIAFMTGILSGIAIFGDIYEITENAPYSVALSALLGAFITAVMLLILKLIWLAVAKVKAIGIKQLEKYKERKSADEKEK